MQSVIGYRPRFKQFGHLGLRNTLSLTEGVGVYAYADSVNGNDANDGFSVLTAKQTIAAVLTVAAAQNRHIRLVRGSHWREVLNLPLSRSAYAFGTGDQPILDASDIAPNASFSKTGGLTNVYQISWAHSIVDSQSKHSVWVNGVRMVRATSTANCDATPGSFFAAAPSAGTPTTVYVHPPGSTVPGSDGKVYEITKREYGIYMPGSNQIDGLYARFCAHTSGCIYAFDNCTIRNCTMKDGWRHNILTGNASWCYDCISEDIEGASTGSSDYVNYSAPNGGTGGFVRCIARGKIQIATNSAGFYAHRTVNAERIDFTDCEVTNRVKGWSAAADFVSSVGGKITDCDYGISIGGTAEILGVFINGLPGPNSRRMIRAIDGGSLGNGVTLTIKGNVFVGSRGISDGGMIWGGSSATGIVWDIQYNSIIGYDIQSYTNGFNPANTTGQTITFRKNICGGMWGAFTIGANALVGATLDENVYYVPGIQWTWGATTHNTIAAYRAASGQDANSALVASPSFPNADCSTWDEIADATPGNATVIAMQAGATFYEAA